MHRERVTCEYSDGQLWGDIEWALNYYITECTGNSISLETRSGRESQHPAEGTIGASEWAVAVGDQMSLETRPVRDKMRLKKPAPREAGPQAFVWPALENGKEMLTAIRMGVNMLQFCSVPNSLSHTTLSNKVRAIFSKRLCCSSLLLLLRSHIHEYGHVRNRHVMFITVEYIKNRNLKNT